MWQGEGDDGEDPDFFLDSDRGECSKATINHERIEIPRDENT